MLPPATARTSDTENRPVLNCDLQYCSKVAWVTATGIAATYADGWRPNVILTPLRPISYKAIGLIVNANIA